MSRHNKHQRGPDSPDADKKQPRKRRGRRKSWYATHGRDLRFLAVFAMLMGGYYFATTTSVVKDDFIPWFLEQNATVSAVVLHTFGYEDMKQRGNALVSSRGAVSVERGCDALDPCALFVAAVLSTPAPVLSKLLSALGGACILVVLNLVRIITLFLTAVHWRSAFDVMHLEVWQALFIILAIVLWMVWASWERNRRRRSVVAETLGTPDQN